LQQFNDRFHNANACRVRAEDCSINHGPEKLMEDKNGTMPLVTTKKIQICKIYGTLRNDPRVPQRSAKATFHKFKCRLKCIILFCRYQKKTHDMLRMKNCIRYQWHAKTLKGQAK
jgi:hypothetical protein